MTVAQQLPQIGRRVQQAALKERAIHLLRIAAVGLVFYVGAAAGYAGSFAKWGFRDGTDLSVEAMIDGTAMRPFVYRQLIPWSAKRLSSLVPSRVKERVVQEGWIAHNGPHIAFSQSQPPEDVDKRFAYQLAYFLSFSGLFLALPLMYWLCRRLGSSLSTSVLVPLIFSILYPLFMTRGGFVYDSVEVCMFLLAVGCASTGRWFELLLLSALATLNKEAFLFFLPTLYPLLRLNMSLRSSLLTVGTGMLISGSVYLLLRQAYAGNPGATSEWHLGENLLYFIDPRNYLGYEANYAVPTTRGLTLPHLALLGLLIAMGWRKLPKFYREHAQLALLINTPLFLLFCWRDELRNLSMLYPTLVLLISATLSAANNEVLAKPTLAAVPSGAQASEPAPAKQKIA